MAAWTVAPMAAWTVETTAEQMAGPWENQLADLKAVCWAVLRAWKTADGSETSLAALKAARTVVP